MTADSTLRPATPPHPFAWTIFAAVAALPYVLLLGITLWRTPYPLSEAVALFEDAVQRPPTFFLKPTTSYYRPLFQVTMSWLWHDPLSVEAKLSAIRLLHIVPLT